MADELGGVVLEQPMGHDDLRADWKGALANQPASAPTGIWSTPSLRVSA